MITLITGGIRAGKSAMALKLAPDSGPKLFIATAEPFDKGMRERIERHKKERQNMGYDTLEEPLEIAGALHNTREKYGFIIIDCLTVWVSNLMHYKGSEDEIINYRKTLIHALQTSDADIVLITNETGWGNIPVNEMTRKYNDYLGNLNAGIAGIAMNVICMISGIPVQVKGKKPPTDF